jgi:hypothetical protein
MDTHGDDREALRQLLAEWASPPAEMIDVIPKGGVELKYLGHAATTRALLECDPTWWWEPIAMEIETALPVLDRDDQGRPIGLWIYLHVCGVRRPGYGSCLPGKSDAVKELIGDALRNAAMRFGVGINLWGKDHPEKDKPAPRKAKATPLPSPVQETHDTKDAGKEAYEYLVDEHGKDLVNGAMAMYGVARFSELTPARVQEIEASLFQRANVVSANEKAAANDPPPL